MNTEPAVFWSILTFVVSLVLGGFAYDAQSYGLSTSLYIIAGTVPICWLVYGLSLLTKWVEGK